MAEQNQKLEFNLVKVEDLVAEHEKFVELVNSIKVDTLEKGAKIWGGCMLFKDCIAHIGRLQQILMKIKEESEKVEKVEESEEEFKARMGMA